MVNIGTVTCEDEKWWLQEIIVQDDTVTFRIDGEILFQYIGPASLQHGERFARTLSEGTSALQGHDPGSVINYRNIRVKTL